MASKQLRVILDDNAGNITYGGGGQWTVSTLVQWYQGTSNYPAFAGGGLFGSLSLTFEGTTVAFIGNTPSSGFSQIATVSIDGGTPYNTTYGPSAPPAYVQWYQSPVLSDGKHAITIDHLAGTAVDMVLITVGPNTALAGKKIFVDDNDPSLQYFGSWAPSTDGFNAGTLPDGLPIGNTTQRTTTVGDTMTFRFSGTSISIYGIFSWTNIGSISTTYTLDGVIASQTYLVTSSSPQHINADGEASNFLFFDKDNLSAGAHTLVLNVTDIENQTFVFDYLVYTPSFSSLATMPNLTTASPPTTTTPTGGSITTKPPTNSDPVTTSNTAQTAIGASLGNASGKSTPIGAIVGGVVGGVAVLVLAIFLFFYLRRRNSKVAQSPSVEQRLALNNDNIAPPQMSVLPASRPSFGHSASLADATPFPTSTTPMGFASISDLKRDRFEQDYSQRGPSPFSGETRSHTTSFDTSHQRNASLATAAPNTAWTGDTDEVEYVPSDSVPPAYDALSMVNMRSSLSPVRRQF